MQIVTVFISVEENEPTFTYAEVLLDGLGHVPLTACIDDADVSAFLQAIKKSITSKLKGNIENEGRNS